MKKRAVAVRAVTAGLAAVALAATAGLGVPASAASAAPAVGTAPATSPARSGWQPPVNVGGTMDAVSCPSSRFCMVVTEDGQALSYDGESWSDPVTIDPGQWLSSVSCPTRFFCVAVDFDGGNVVTFDGSSWSAPTQIDSRPDPLFESVSCASPRLCVTGGFGGRTFVYDGSSWHRNGRGLIGVSCTSATFCMAVNHGAGSMTFDGTTWHQAGSTHDGIDTAVSCSSDRFCASVGRLSKVNVWHRGSWGKSVRIMGRGPGLYAVSCAGPKFCVTIHNQVYFRYNGTRWVKQARNPKAGTLGVSCPSPRFCAAVNSLGYVSLYLGGDRG